MRKGVLHAIRLARFPVSECGVVPANISHSNAHVGQLSKISSDIFSQRKQYHAASLQPEVFEDISAECSEIFAAACKS